jgi:hypothetical protein
LVAVLVTMSLRAGRIAVERVMLIEPIELSDAPKLDRMEQWAIQGDSGFIARSKQSATNFWAAVDSLDATHAEKHFVEAFVPGTLRSSFAFRTMNGRTRSKLLGFRMAAGPGDVPATVAWLCGHQKVADGMKPLGEDMTTFDGQELPSGCRAP